VYEYYRIEKLERAILYAFNATDETIQSSGMLKCWCVSVDKAASIANMCIMPDEFKRRLSDCGQYCPVSLADNQLIDCSSYARLTFAAEFRGNVCPVKAVLHITSLMTATVQQRKQFPFPKCDAWFLIKINN